MAETKHPNVKTFLSRYPNNSIYLAVPEKHSRFGSYCFTGGVRFIPCNTHMEGAQGSQPVLAGCLRQSDPASQRGSDGGC